MKDIHLWFELSHANYLTIPRSVLESMPLAWQYNFTKLLDELDATIDWRPKEGRRYFVTLEDEEINISEYNENARVKHFDPWMEYRHPSKEIRELRNSILNKGLKRQL